MTLLVDSCAGRKLAAWLREKGHNVFDASDLEVDPGDEELLRLAAVERRVLVTLDKHFSALVFASEERHAGLLLLPDVRVAERLRLVARVLERHTSGLEGGAVITVRGARLRVSWPPARR